LNIGRSRSQGWIENLLLFRDKPIGKVSTVRMNTLN
jgi:hypothetical protein